jgi:hypothetical protein
MVLTVDPQKWKSFCDRFVLNPHRTAAIDGAIAAVDAVNRLVAESLTAITARYDQRQPRRVRVFRGNMLDYACTEQLIFDGYAGNDPLDWLAYLGASNLCIAVNDLDAWGPGLAEFCAGELVPALAHYLEQRWLVVDWYCFISGVGWTPFGIHTDDEPSLLFNLGPGTKTAWIWEPEVLSGLSHGRPTSLWFHALLDDATACTLRPGDAIAIPAGHFHVLRSDSPCTLLGAGLYPVSYAAELAAFLRRHSPLVHRDCDAAANNMAALLPVYVANRQSPAHDLDRCITYLRAKTKSLSFSRRPRYGIPTLPPLAGDTFDAQEFVVMRHPIVVASEQVALANGHAVPIATHSADAAALRTWLLQHPRFQGRHYLDQFLPSEADEARRIANQLLRFGNLRVSGAA